ncbi:hypothetical protein OSCT_2662 [Oscillochloris trichoides DG-6]|uniref:Quinol:cytochrome c oxidoreductase membrane protein n=1 Tax=Oscillochloris trichoides DG-6 TaxID=765420 RepID=E1IH61_9CHLR|nr:DUF3341 domain-containing protein [Oscillochloris trichoides]EFO79536.1 hypothetical protein OSCT_2662 [Oscillochloris trichoides DG-6]
MQASSDIYGVMAEFSSPSALIEASKKAREAGYRKMDAYSPFPIEEVSEEVAPGDTGVPRIVLICGLTGATTGFITQAMAQFVDYPLIVGGRPNNITNWAAMIPMTFEFGILFSAFGAVFGMLALNGLPALYHPTFNAPRFERASQDAFFLCIESTDPLFDRAQTSQFLRSLNPLQVSEVTH